LLKNKVPKIGVAFVGTEEARLRESEKFRKYAADCIRIASQMNGKDRQALLEIADAWETRAQDAEKKEKGLRSWTICARRCRQRSRVALAPVS
jgi:hypothetical protein